MAQATKKTTRRFHSQVENSTVVIQSNSDEASLSLDDGTPIGLCMEKATKERVLLSIIMRLDSNVEFYPMIQHSDLLDDEGNFKSESNLPHTTLGAMLFENMTPHKMRYSCWLITLGKLRKVKDLWMSTYAKDY